MNTQIVLAAHVRGVPKRANFAVRMQPIPHCEDGKILIRNLYLGFVPAVRARMYAGFTGGGALEVGDVLPGQTVGEVVDSRHPAYKAGDMVALLGGGWQVWVLSDGSDATRIDTSIAPLPAWLGVLGTSGFTAWVGLNVIGQMRASDTVVVSSAAGSVGSIVGQLAKSTGGRAIGIAGGAEKCRYVVEILGFYECIDYRSPDFVERLKAVCGSSVDVFFDNVGGAVRDAVWPHMRMEGRVVVCGMAAEYDGKAHGGPDWSAILWKRLTVRGFVLSDHMAMQPRFRREAAALLRSGRLVSAENIVSSLEAAPEAFLGMLAGNNVGKVVVQL